jgi:DNA polymerase-3 subunit beta
MNFRIGKQAFLKELGLVQGVVEKKSTIPILVNLLIEARDGGIEIRATDLDLSITSFCEAEVLQPGALCIPAKKLFEIVRALPEAEVELKRGEREQVTLTCERSRFRLNGVATENFPEIKAIPDGALSFPAPIFRTLIGRTIFASSTEESRFTLNGAKLEMGEEGIRVVATDGHRLAFIEKKMPITGQPLDLLVPKKALAELSRLSAEADDLLEVAFHQNLLFFRLGNRVLTSRTLTGQFPNYEMVLPKENHHSFVVESSRLAGALRRIALVADDRSHAIKFELLKDLVQITATTAEVGDGVEQLTVEYEGPAITIGFNVQYLLDFLSVINEGDIRLEFKDGSSQVQLRPHQEIDFDYRYIVMPLRV